MYVKVIFDIHLKITEILVVEKIGLVHVITLLRGRTGNGNIANPVEVCQPVPIVQLAIQLPGVIDNIVYKIELPNGSDIRITAVAVRDDIVMERDVFYTIGHVGRTTMGTAGGMITQPQGLVDHAPLNGHIARVCAPDFAPLTLN